MRQNSRYNINISKITSFVMSLIMVLLQCTISTRNIALAATKNIQVNVNGKDIVFDQPPMLDVASGRVLVPMRAIFEALGYSVEWDPSQQKAVATKKNSTSRTAAIVSVGYECLIVEYTDYLNETDAKNNRYWNNYYFEVPLSVDNPLKVMNGRTLLPTRAVAESLGAKVNWDSASKTVFIDTQGAKITTPEGWETAIQEHYKKMHPELYRPDLAHKGAYDDIFTFNGIKGHQNSADSLNTVTENQTTTTITEHKEVNTKAKTYKVYDYTWSKWFEYTYKKPTMPTNPPTVGSFPAKILIDESCNEPSYLVSQDSDPKNPDNWKLNLLPEYSVNLLSLGGCEWYASGRFWEVYGIPLPHFKASEDKKFLDADYYLDAADKYDELTAIRDINDIRPYSIAVSYSPTKGGHVEFVEFVERDTNGNPTYVYITEANADNTGGRYTYGVDGRIKKYEYSYFLNRGGKPIIGYIVPNAEYYQ